MTLTALNYIKAEPNNNWRKRNEGKRANKLIKKWTLKRWEGNDEKNNIALNILNRNLWMASSANFSSFLHDFNANKDATCWKLLWTTKKCAFRTQKSRQWRRFLESSKKSLSFCCCCCFSADYFGKYQTEERLTCVSSFNHSRFL